MQPWLLCLAAIAVPIAAKFDVGKLRGNCLAQGKKLYKCLDKNQKNHVSCCDKPDNLKCKTGGGCGDDTTCKLDSDCCTNESPDKQCNAVECPDGTICLTKWGCAKNGKGCERMFCYDFSDSRAARKMECGRSSGCAIDARGGCATKGKGAAACYENECNGVTCKRKKKTSKVCPKYNGCKTDLTEKEICSPTPAPTTTAVVPTTDWINSTIDPGIQYFVDRNETCLIITVLHNKTMVSERKEGNATVVVTESEETMEMYTFWLLPHLQITNFDAIYANYIPANLKPTMRSADPINTAA